MKIVNSLISMICIMLSVAFFTLLERKVLGSGQSRKGPDKNSLFGIFQPVLDALKLFSKEEESPINSLFLSFMIFPFVSLFLFLIFWGSCPKFILVEESAYQYCFFLVLSSIFGAVICMSGWSSSSAYSRLGSIRALIQFLSYEILISFLFVSLMVLMTSFSFQEKNLEWQVFFSCLIFLFFLTILGESHRTPFDFSEGESELVSGFNTDYSSVFFSVIFLSEYGSLCLMFFILSWTISTMMWLVLLSVVFFCMVSILVRAVSPRLRIDLFQSLFWLVVLPISMTVFFSCLIFL